MNIAVVSSYLFLFIRPAPSTIHTYKGCHVHDLTEHTAAGGALPAMLNSKDSASKHVSTSKQIVQFVMKFRFTWYMEEIWILTSYLSKKTRHKYDFSNEIIGCIRGTFPYLYSELSGVIFSSSTAMKYLFRMKWYDIYLKSLTWKEQSRCGILTQPRDPQLWRKKTWPAETSMDCTSSCLLGTSIQQPCNNILHLYSNKCIRFKTMAVSFRLWLFSPSQWFTVLGRLTVYMMQLLKVYMQK